METTKNYDLNDFAEVSARMEKNDGSNTGKGFVTYYKDGEMYEMEVLYVNGQKEGKGILRDKSGNIVGNYFFRHDELCILDDVDNSGKSDKSKRLKSSKIHFNPLNNNKSLWKRIILFVILLLACYLIYEFIYVILIPMYFDDNSEVILSNCEFVRHNIGKEYYKVGRVISYLDRACDNYQDDPFLLNLFTHCYSLKLHRGDKFTSLNIINADYLERLEINDFNSVKDISLSSLNDLQYLYFHPYSLASVKILALNNLNNLDTLVIEEGALSSLENLSLSLYSKYCSIVIKENGLQSLTTFEIEDKYNPLVSLSIKEGALPRLDSISNTIQKAKDIGIGDRALQSIKEISIRGGYTRILRIYSEMKSMTKFEIEWSEYLETIEFSSYAIQHVKTFSLRYLHSLHTIYFGRYMLNSTEVFELISLPKLDKLYIPSDTLTNVKTFTLRQLNKLRSISFGELSLQSLTELILNGNELPNLEKFECYSKSFISVSRLEITNFANLQTLTFGENSFTESFDSEPIMKGHKSASIINCPSLQSIELQEYAMSEFVELNLHDLPKLSSIIMGGFSFLNLDRFIIRGNINHYFDLIKLIILDLPLLTRITIGSEKRASVFSVRETIFDSMH